MIWGPSRRVSTCWPSNCGKTASNQRSRPVLAQGEVLEFREAGEALVAERLEVIGGAHPEARSGVEAVRGHDRGVELARALHVQPAEDRQERPGDADEGRCCHRVEGGVELGRKVGEVGGDVAGDVVDQYGKRILEIALVARCPGGVLGSREGPDVAEVGRLRVHDAADDEELDALQSPSVFRRGGDVRSDGGMVRCEGVRDGKPDEDVKDESEPRVRRCEIMHRWPEALWAKRKGGDRQKAPEDRVSRLHRGRGRGSFRCRRTRMGADPSLEMAHGRSDGQSG